MKPIYLIGPNGAGKSCVMRELAFKLERPLFDQDRVFGAKNKCFIPYLLKKHGWKWIVPILAKILDEVEFFHIVAVSGSSLMSKYAPKKLNEKYIKQVKKGVVILLLPTNNDEKNIKILYKRECTRSSYIPVLAQARKKYYERIKIFKKLADHIVYSENTPEKTAKKIETLLLALNA